MDTLKPELTELNRPYWDALRDGHLMVQRCTCGHAWLPARKHCPECLSPDPDWERVSGKGTLLSWVVYHVAYHPAFKDRLPYNVALVQLDEGPRMITNIIVDDNSKLVADAPVELEIAWEGDTALARFRQMPSLPAITIP